MVQMSARGERQIVMSGGVF